MPDGRVGLHEDAGLRSVHAGMPGTFRADDLPLRVELLRVFAEIPDVAVLVLHVVVARPFGQPATQEQAIVDDDAPDAVNRGRAVGDREDLYRRLFVLGSPIPHRRAGLVREPRIVDGCDEVDLVDRKRAGAL